VGGVSDAEAFGNSECYVRRVLKIVTIRGMARRFRFSLKWMLIAFLIFGVTFYFLFVRPTVLAIRVLSLVKTNDLSALSRLGIEIPKTQDTYEYRSTEGRIQPRQWSDTWHCRRRVEIESKYLGCGFEASDFIIVHKAVDTNPIGMQVVKGYLPTDLSW
jgi:hypothetical protein